MANRNNELFIGRSKMNMEGRSLKHPALISHYATPNANKISDDILKVFSMDIETESTTGELKLLGFWDGTNYSHYESNFLRVLFSWVRYAKSENTALTCWNRLDPFIMLKLFLLESKEPMQSLDRFGKISGEWNNKSGTWDVNPVVSIKIGDQYFGIKNAIRSSIQFFYYREGDTQLNMIWCFDVAQLYQSGLQKEAEKRFDYYSKVDKSAHLVDWKRYNIDVDYRENIVLKSNKLDCRACYDLALSIQEDFKTAFGYYPKTLISQGSLARSAIVASLSNKYKGKYTDEKKLKQRVFDDIKSIGIMEFYDEWAENFGKETMKDLYCLFTETYSGGYIEAIRFGYAKKGWYADIASAYPGVIAKLYDLRGSKVITGKGTPKQPKHAYTFIRGTITVPKNVNFHPVTIKHPININTNIRATGTYMASYTFNERVFLKQQGATFKDEHYYIIQTTGKPSPLALVCNEFIELRKRLKAEGNSSEYMAKIASNSLYGILFEAVDTYFEIMQSKIIKHPKDNYYMDMLKPYRKNINLESIKNDLRFLYDEDYPKIMARWNNKHSQNTPDIVAEELEAQGVKIDDTNMTDIFLEINDLYQRDLKQGSEEVFEHPKVLRNGYRAGEYWNPLFASIITSETRILMAKASTAIEKAGGKPIVMMTDSILWEGTKDMMPKEFVRDVKTLGYFETPEPITDIVCLGSGRYGFKNAHGYYEAKRRGLNITDIQNKDGISVDSFNWINALKIMEEQKDTKIKVQVRTLISPGVVLHNHSFNIKDLGLIVDQKREVEAIVGKSKRYYDDGLKDPNILANKLVDTYPINIDPSMFGKYEIMNQTLPKLRTELMKKKLKTRQEKNRNNSNNTSKRYYDKNQSKLLDKYKEKYNDLKQYGYTPQERKRMAGWSDESLKLKLIEDGKTDE